MVWCVHADVVISVISWSCRWYVSVISCVFGLYATSYTLSEHFRDKELTVYLKRYINSPSLLYFTLLYLSTSNEPAFSMQCNDDYGHRREPLCPHQLNKQLW